MRERHVKLRQFRSPPEEPVCEKRLWKFDRPLDDEWADTIEGLPVAGTFMKSAAFFQLDRDRSSRYSTISTEIVGFDARHVTFPGFPDLSRPQRTPPSLRVSMKSKIDLAQSAGPVSVLR
jgi:hypothetical protein